MINFDERQSITGNFALNIYRGGKLVEQIDEKNLVVKRGRCRMAQLICGKSNSYIKYIGLGTGTDSANDDDSHLKAQVTLELKNEAGGDFASVSGSDVTFFFDILPHQCNDMDISEFALFCADGEMFCHRVRDGVIKKEADMELTGEWTIHF